MVQQMPLREPLLTVEDVAQRLNVTKDWVWDHSSRKAPYLRHLYARCETKRRHRFPIFLPSAAQFLQSCGSGRRPEILTFRQMAK
jgi:hypothetical protein